MNMSNDSVMLTTRRDTDYFIIIIYFATMCFIDEYFIIIIYFATMCFIDEYDICGKFSVVFFIREASVDKQTL